MKEYNRKTKRWEEKSTEKVGDLKREKLCKGHRPHDFVLVLPPYTRLQNGAPYLTAIQIKHYYLSEDRRRYDEKVEDEFQETLGIKISRWMKGEVTRYFVCSNCGKKK